MKIAIVGGIHGNEPVGIEVIKYLESNPPVNCKHEFQCFLGNPEAYKQKKRFIDTDLNRTFGKFGKRVGFEGLQSEKLSSLIEGRFDFILDLHTTTSNMGLTLLLNNQHPTTRQAAVYLQSLMPEIKIIEGMKLGKKCPYTNSMAPAGITIEVGPVANNVLDGGLILATHKMVKAILEWGFSEEFDLSKVEYYKSFGEYKFPKEDGWFIHPEFEASDFKQLAPGDPVFINLKEEALGFDFSESVIPFFINEAAYQEDRLAMTMARKVLGFIGTMD